MAMYTYIHEYIYIYIHILINIYIDRYSLYSSTPIPLGLSLKVGQLVEFLVQLSGIRFQRPYVNTASGALQFRETMLARGAGGPSRGPPQGNRSPI